ncbi:MAG TPA: hypothetical protein VLS53_06220 [Candidatus Dormibacteraeota bacterium]|nr:hypothetical protein [Candidatus Dormibacteraeota bacterium]
MAANVDQLPEDGTQRLLIRPKQATVIAFSVAMGVTFSLFAGALLVMGSPVAALICVGICGSSIYAMASWHLWVDSERVGVTRFPFGASCRRDQLARLQISLMGRGGHVCAFIRKDGYTAFRVSAKPFGSAQLKALAQSLGVPYYDAFSGGPFDFKSLI